MVREKEEVLTLIQDVIDKKRCSEEEFYKKNKKIVEDYIKYKYPTINFYDLQDCISCIIGKIFENLNKYDSTKSTLKSWIISITKNHMIDFWRNNKYIQNGIVKIPSSTININDFNYITSNTPISNFENENTLTYISTHISPIDYTYLDMKYVQGYDYNEIGEKFQLSSSTISNRINYIKSKLRKNLINEIKMGD